MDELLAFLKCVSDENRLKMLKLLLEDQYCVCQLQELLDKSQSSISQHLSYFKELDLLEEKPSKKWTYYTINRKKYDSYLAGLIGLSSKSLSELNLDRLADKVDNLETAVEITAEKSNKRCCQ
ncbi:MAG: ArsR/SmtB family transcription factor [Bacillota bacterium]